MPPDLRVIATLRSESQAEMVRVRLIGAGIPAMLKHDMRTDIPDRMLSSHDVYVRSADVARAHELLGAREFSDEELGALSERSFERITGHRSPGT